MHSTKQWHIIDGLKALVNNRFNIETLTKHLSQLAGEPIILSDTTADKDEDDTSDYNLLFTITQEEMFGYFDIYYLKMRKPGHNGATMYITEVAYQFE